MRRMVRAAQPQGVPTAPPTVDATPQRRRRLLPQVPHFQNPSGTKRKTPPSRIPVASQGRRRRLQTPPSETPKRGKTPSGTKRSCLPVPVTPEDLQGVTLKPTPATKKTTPLPGPHHLKSSITPESLASQSAKLKKVGLPRTTRQTNPWMASLASEIDKRRRAMDPDYQSRGELKGLEKKWKTWK